MVGSGTDSSNAKLAVERAGAPAPKESHDPASSASLSVEQARQEVIDCAESVAFNAVHGDPIETWRVIEKLDTLLATVRAEMQQEVLKADEAKEHWCRGYHEILDVLDELWLWASEQRIHLESDPVPDGLGARVMDVLGGERSSEIVHEQSEQHDKE